MNFSHYKRLKGVRKDLFVSILCGSLELLCFNMNIGRPIHVRDIARVAFACQGEKLLFGLGRERQIDVDLLCDTNERIIVDLHIALCIGIGQGCNGRAQCVTLANT